MNYREIIVDKAENIATLTLNRPEKLNALGPNILDEMADAIEAIHLDDDIRVLIFTGTGRAFCSGADLSGPVSGTDPRPDEMLRRARIAPFARFGRMVLAIRNLTKPTIAAVNGLAVGAGLSISCLCDIRIASTEARFSSIFVRRGLVADMGATYFLPRHVGISKALELMYTGDIISAEEAKEIGLVSKIVPPDQLMPATLELARRIAKGPSLAIEMMKRMVYEGLEMNHFLAQLAAEAFCQGVCDKSEDAKEGRESFLQKREAAFKGR